MSMFDNDFPIGFMVGAAAVGLIWSIAPSYKDGHVAALTGEVRYELITLPDSTREWREIE